jgi:hypothetical protein
MLSITPGTWRPQPTQEVLPAVGALVGPPLEERMKEISGERKATGKEDILQVEQLAFQHILLRFAFAFDFDALYFGDSISWGPDMFAF